MSNDSGVRGVSEGGTPRNREDITVGHQVQGVKVYRTDGFPPIFAGFRQNWIDATQAENKEDGTLGVEADLSSGAGWGSPYLTLTVRVKGPEIVYEYVDIREFFEARINAIVKEIEDKEEEVKADG